MQNKNTFLLIGILFILSACASSSSQNGTQATTTCSTCQERAQANLVAGAKPAPVAAPAAVSVSPTPTQKEEGIVKVNIETTLGLVEIKLFAAEAPKTVENFVKLAEKGFYNGIIFHRVIPDFMVQTGDPTGTGMGGPGYQFADEFTAKQKHSKPGILSMANSGPGTNGSQFFITVAATPWLDGKHSVFGEVSGGMDIVKQISMVNRDRSDKPIKEIKMIKLTVLK